MADEESWRALAEETDPSVGALQKAVVQWEKEGFGLFACELLDPPGDADPIVGESGFAKTAEIAWRFPTSAASDELDNEAVTAVLSWAFGNAVFAGVTASLPLGDRAGRDLVDALGMRPIHRTVPADRDWWVDRYELSTSDWNDRGLG